MRHRTALRVLAPLALTLLLTGCAGVLQSIREQPCALDPREPFTVVEAVPGQHEIRLYWRDASGEPFLTLAAVRQHVEAQGDSLVMATNAGIFEPGFTPTGLHLEDGVERQPVNRAEGEGNFFLQPNGVFFVTHAAAAGVVTTGEWPVDASTRLATQSGPLLLREGRMHPRFREGSESCRLRSGVGVREDGSVVFAISNGALNFHDFAVFFRDDLATPDALYLDGGRSRMLYPAGGRVEDGQFAGILAVVVPREELDPRALLIDGATLIDGTGGPATPDAAVLVRNGRIAEIGGAGEVRAPAGAVVIDGSGGFLIPGLIDVHAHVTYLHEPRSFTGYDREVSEQILRQLLRYGITTARNPAAPAEEGVRLRDDLAAGVITGPRLFTAGEIIHGGAAATEHTLRDEVRRQADAGVDFLKTYAGADSAQLTIVVDEARRLGLPVVAHLQAANPREAADAGVGHITHAASWSASLLPEERRTEYLERIRAAGHLLARLDWLEWIDLDGPEVQASIDAVASGGVTMDPTLVAYAPRFLQQDPRWRTRRELAEVPAAISAAWEESFPSWSAGDQARAVAVWPVLLDLTRRYHAAGVLLAAGSDLPNPYVIPGASLHDELELLHAAGISTLEVIRIGTFNGAAVLGIDAEVGSIEIGKRADLVLLDADPLADILNTRRIRTVIQGGAPVTHGDH